MRQIIWNEWRFLVRSRALRFITLGFVLLLGTSVFLGQQQAKSLTARYSEASDHLREQWESIDDMNPHGAAHYGTYIFKPTNLLNGLDAGVNSVTGNVLRVEGHVQNEMVPSAATEMQAITKFGQLRQAL